MAASVQVITADFATRATLLGERSRLLSEAAALEGREHNACQSLAHAAGADDGDLAGDVFEAELAAGLGRTVRAHLIEVDAALARLDAGSYARCEECGEEISRERLEALPRARRCISCQQKAERRSSMPVRRKA